MLPDPPPPVRGAYTRESRSEELPPKVCDDEVEDDEAVAQERQRQRHPRVRRHDVLVPEDAADRADEVRDHGHELALGAALVQVREIRASSSSVLFRL